MSDDSLKMSYTAANTFPAKLLKTKDVPDQSGRIPPIHLQLNPTNRCNLNCDFCSCSARDKTLEWDFELAKKTISEAVSIGCRAATITGGGEPLLYSKINELITYLCDLNISVGLVTNGTQFSKLDPEVLNKIVWVRISHSDDRPFYPSLLDSTVLSAPAVDWAFSYVLSTEPNVDTLCAVVNYANNRNFTHVRIVSDLLRLREIHHMSSVRIYIRAQGISDELVIYQGRKEFVHGREKCLISLLKPVIGADGMIYPCCIHEDEAIPVVSGGLIKNKRISDIDVGDYSIVPDGLFEIREKIKSNKRTALRITLKNGRSIVCSKDHLLFVADNINIRRPYPREKILSNYNLKATKAMAIHLGDMVPVMYRQPSIKHTEINLSPEMARILGYYSGEGWLDKKGGLGFMFGKKDKHLKDLLDCLSAENIPHTVYERRTGYQIMVYSILNHLVESWDAGCRSSEKSVPFPIFNSPDAIKKEYLKAYIRADGSVSAPREDYNGFRVRISTVSRKLASDIVFLFNLLGIEPTLFLQKREGKHVIEGRTVNMKDIYRIRISGYYNLSKMRERLDIDIYRGVKGQKRAIANPKNENMMLLPVKSIEEIGGGTFYDLKVVGTRFCAGAGSVLVHNCGTQYAMNPPAKDYDPRMCMGPAVDIRELYLTQKYFEGNHCKRCYYDNYNEILGNMTAKIEHMDFV